MDCNHFASTFVKRHKLTVSMIAIGIIYLITAVWFSLDLFEVLIEEFHKFQKLVEPYEGDEVIPALILIAVGVFGDLLRQRRHARDGQKMSRQRLAVMRATMGDVHDVVNNFLNNMQLFRFEAESSGALGREHLEQFDNLIAQTASKLKEIDETPAAKAQTVSLND